ncbi:MAG: T9SS type A sorting domain-containing protein, partial [Schleiferiaceae bacterium]
YITVETSKSGQLVIYNTIGALVKTKALNPGKNAISVAELSNGVYLYSVDGSSFKKLIIRH